MSKLYISPSEYYSGYRILEEFGEKVKKYGEKILVLTDNALIGIFAKAFKSLENEKIEYKIELFNGHCSHKEINRLVEIIKDEKFDAIVGLGGGKVIDTAKVAGYKAFVKIITVPTIAATCAAWSSHSAVYDEEGVYEEYFDIYKNPDLLFMDKKIIQESPVRYTVSGIVDTLAKWIETDAFTSKIDEKNLELDYAIYLAKRSYDELLDYGIKVVENIKQGIYSKEIEKTIDHIILTAGLIGGIGGQACRSVAAHAVNNGFTVLNKRYNRLLHGEVVGFGNIVQMVLDKKSEEEIIKLGEFYKAIGAPLSLKDLGYDNLTEDEIKKIIEKTVVKTESIWNLSYEINFDIVKVAVIKADEIMKKLKN